MTTEPVREQIPVPENEDVGTLTRDSDALVIEMMKSANEAPEPGSGVTTVTRGKDADGVAADDIVTPMVTTKPLSAGYVWLYDLRDGESSITNRNMLRTQLRKIDKDTGKYVFTVNPKEAPKPTRGTMKCLLHARHPLRDRADKLGFAVCLKGTLASEFHVLRHMQRTHKTEWAVLEHEREERVKEDDRQFQRELLGRLAGAPAASGGGPVAQQRGTHQISVDCDVCGEKFFGGKKMIAMNRIKKHKKDGLCHQAE
jgi:hypothetical protein